MNYRLEPDRIQCQAKKQDGHRCTSIGTHSDGGKVLCSRHLQLARRDRANAQPVKEKK